ncbi:hypothetical protein HS5152_2102 [Enterococcus faecalis]|nr:hypothetical protein HS5152_2102 [Enterococcus faecalis]OSH15471.1 hypothetical protein HS5302_2178 [Enterococcus faecalis]
MYIAGVSASGVNFLSINQYAAAPIMTNKTAIIPITFKNLDIFILLYHLKIILLCLFLHDN